MDTNMLQEQDRQKLDKIVSQMISNKESDETIKLVVSDFKQKYAKQTPEVADVPQTDSNRNTLMSGVGSNIKESVTGLLANYGGGEQGIANRLKQDIQAGASDIQQGNILKGIAKSGLRTSGDVAGLVYAPVATGLNVATGGILGKFFEDSQKSLEQGKGILGQVVNKLAEIPEFQKYALEHPNAGDDFGRALNLLTLKGETGKIDRAFTEPKAILNEIYNESLKSVQKTPTQVKSVLDSTFKKTPEQIVKKRLDALNEIDSNYANMRKASGFSDDGGLSSRTRVASTDVLVGSIDDTGTIRTKGPNGPIEQYRKLTLDQAEDVVKNNLLRLGEKTSLDEVRIRLEDNVKNSGLEGADLAIALKKIDSEIEGLKLRADENGLIPLSALQDAKISTTNQINYLTPPEINAYRKSVARTYKETIEKNSSLNVKEINSELSKYLEDISFLERLDGRKVKGGKLGKYFAQISGNIIGGAAGGAIGGPIGTALGTIAGGELAGRIKGSMLEKSLGGSANKPVTKSPVLQGAITKSKSDRLALPAPLPNRPRSSVGSGPVINLPKKSQTLQLLEDIYSNKPNKK